MVFSGLRRAHRSPSPPNGQIADDARLCLAGSRHSLLDFDGRRLNGRIAMVEAKLAA